MILPYISKCKHCGKSLSFGQWARLFKETFNYALAHVEAGAKKEEVIQRIKEKILHEQI